MMLMHFVMTMISVGGLVIVASYFTLILGYVCVWMDKQKELVGPKRRRRKQHAGSQVLFVAKAAKVVYVSVSFY